MGQSDIVNLNTIRTFNTSSPNSERPSCPYFARPCYMFVAPSHLSAFSFVFDNWKAALLSWDQVIYLTFRDTSVSVFTKSLFAFAVCLRSSSICTVRHIQHLRMQFSVTTFASSHISKYTLGSYVPRSRVSPQDVVCFRSWTVYHPIVFILVSSVQTA